MALRVPNDPQRQAEELTKFVDKFFPNEKIAVDSSEGTLASELSAEELQKSLQERIIQGFYLFTEFEGGPNFVENNITLIRSVATFIAQRLMDTVYQSPMGASDLADVWTKTREQSLQLFREVFAQDSNSPGNKPE